MGTWATGSFQNDAALDWIDELIETNNINLLRDTLEAVLEEDDYIELDLASAAVAAAEVITVYLNPSHSLLSEELSSWIKQHHFSIGKDLKRRALKALERVE